MSTPLTDLWDAHVHHEFGTKDTDATLETMVDDAYVNHVPVLTGGSGRAQLREFYAEHFISKMPSDLEMIPVSRTVGEDRLVDEMVLRFTHNTPMDWALPGVPPTGRRVVLPLVVVAQFRDGKLATERIYWDQASLLVQLGLLQSDGLPVAGAESGEKVLDPTRASNRLIERATRRRL
jgi:carboxymethylenebutenolidase